MAPRFVARDDRAPMAAREPALRLGKSGAKHSFGRSFTTSGTLRELPVSNLGREQERMRTPHGPRTGESSCRTGSKNDTLNAVPGPAVDRRPGAESQTAIRLPSSECVDSVERCVRTGQVMLPGPCEPMRQPIPQHRAVGRLVVTQRSLSRGSQLHSVRRIGATRSARSPTGDTGQPKLSSIPCRHTLQFSVVEQSSVTMVAIKTADDTNRTWFDESACVQSACRLAVSGTWNESG